MKELLSAADDKFSVFSSGEGVKLEFDPAKLLRLGTWNGAFALGLDAETGSLAVGKAADLVMIELAAIEATDPHDLLFRPESQIRSVMWTGWFN